MMSCSVIDVITTEPQLAVRSARLTDVDLLNHWDTKPHIRRAVSIDGSSSFDADWEFELSNQSEVSRFFIAELNQRAFGAMQIIDPANEPTHYWGPISDTRRAIDIWIGEESMLGQGLGTQMMSFAIDYCFKNKHVNAIVIDPLINNYASHRFYQRLGFQPMLRLHFSPESDCLIFMLTRTTWQQRPIQKSG